MTTSGVDAPAGPSNHRYPPVSPWVGWIAFAAFLLFLAGMLHVMQGLVALLREEYFVVPAKDLAVPTDYTTYGWIHLIGGVLLLLAGVGVLAANRWARALGVVLCYASAITNVFMLGANPVWSLIAIVLAVIIIMALTVHGSEIKPG
jgi:hypothetical protein